MNKAQVMKMTSSWPRASQEANYVHDEQVRRASSRYRRHGGVGRTGIDKRSAAESPAVRVFVLGLAGGGLDGQGINKPGREVMVINSKSWPLTERLCFTVGDTVHWRKAVAARQLDADHLVACGCQGASGRFSSVDVTRIAAGGIMVPCM